MSLIPEEMLEILLIRLHKHLTSFKYDIFTDVDSIRAEYIWSNTIEQNISTGDIFVLIVTGVALRSPEVEKDIDKRKE